MYNFVDSLRVAVALIRSMRSALCDGWSQDVFLYDIPDRSSCSVLYLRTVVHKFSYSGTRYPRESPPSLRLDLEGYL
jgi:hypothetical protein